MRVVRGCILGLFLVVSTTLLVIAGVSTSFITGNSAEHTYFVPDSLLANVAVSAAVLGVAWFAIARTESLRTRLDRDSRAFAIARVVLLGVAGVSTAAWVLLTQATPGSDALWVQDAAAAALSGDYSAFANDAYMGTYLNQAGLFWISYLFALVVGLNNYLAFQLFNVVGAVLVVKMLGDLAGVIGASRSQQLGALLAGIAFFPLLQYASFVYGSVWGLALSLVAVKHELLFFERSDWRHAAASALAICLAMTFKGNYVVFFIAMVLYALFELLRRRDVRTLAIATLFAAAFAIQAVVPVAAARAVSGYPLDQGCSSWSWVAMGLQDGERAPGWYNGYNQRSYERAGFDSEKQALAAKASIAGSALDFASDPMGAAAFFAQKTASQWNNPTFQGFWNVQVRKPLASLTPFASWLTSAQDADAMARYLNYLQFFILLGTVFWCLSVPWAGKRVDGKRLCDAMLPLVFLGGFACHLFWKAKCQYTISYFELLLPLAVMGHVRFLAFVRERARNRQAGRPALANGLGQASSLVQASRAEQKHRMVRQNRLVQASRAEQASRAKQASYSPKRDLQGKILRSDTVVKAACIALVTICAIAFALSPASCSMYGDEQAYQDYLSANTTVRLAGGK